MFPRRVAVVIALLASVVSLASCNDGQAPFEPAPPSYTFLPEENCVWVGGSSSLVPPYGPETVTLVCDTYADAIEQVEAVEGLSSMGCRITPGSQGYGFIVGCSVNFPPMGEGGSGGQYPECYTQFICVDIWVEGQGWVEVWCGNATICE